MRQLGMAIRIAIAVLMFGAVSSSTAVAAVETIGGDFELRGTMAYNQDPDPSPGYDHIMCHVDLSVDVDHEGAIEVTDVDAFLPYYDYSHQCRWPSGTDYWFNDCDDAGWTGQILGPGDSWETPNSEILVEYQGTGDFEAVIDGCIHLSNGHFPFTFAIDEGGTQDEVWSFLPQLVGPGSMLSEATCCEGVSFTDPSNHTSLSIQSVE